MNISIQLFSFKLLKITESKELKNSICNVDGFLFPTSEQEPHHQTHFNNTPRIVLLNVNDPQSLHFRTLKNITYDWDWFSFYSKTLYINLG